jgi:hypothetical protein
MLPFIEIQQIITNNENEEKEVTTRLQPNEIEYYYPGFHWGTVIVFKSRNSILTPMSVDEFDSALLGYQDFCLKNIGRFGNIKLTPKSNLHVTS